MSVKIDREKFLQALQRVEPGRTQKDYLTQSSCFILGDGAVCCFNDEIFCHTRTGLPDEFAGAVAGNELLQIIEGIRDDEVSLEIEERQIVVRGNRKRMGVRLQREVVLPIENVKTPDRWVPLPEDFRQAVEQVCGIAGTDKSEFLTTCVHLHPDYIEASNRRQAMRHDLTWDISRPFLVRATTLAHVAKIDVVRVGETDEWVHFRNKTMVFSCRRHLEDYPDLTNVFDFKGEPATLPKGADEAAKLAGVFIGEDKTTDKVLVTLTNGLMTVRGDGAHGWAEIDIDTAYKGEEVTFRIPPVVLSNIVSTYNDCEIQPERLRVVGENWKFFSVLGLPGGEPGEREPEPVSVGASEGQDESQNYGD